MSKKLINEPPLLVLPSLAIEIGLNEAIVVQQMHYLLEKSKHEHEGLRWVYNTYEDWQATCFPFWSTRTIQRILQKLEEIGVVESTDRFNKVPTDRTKWYTIHYERIEASEDDKLSRSSDPNWHAPRPRQVGMLLPKRELLPESDGATTTKTVFRMYEEAFGYSPKGPIEIGIIHEIEDEFENDFIQEAFTEAVKNNVRKLSYVESILRRSRDESRRPGERKGQSEQPPAEEWRRVFR